MIQDVFLGVVLFPATENINLSSAILKKRIYYKCDSGLQSAM
jgi:hypothetical protein